MRCETCHGQGEVLIDRRGRIVERLADAVARVPCPEMHAGTILHCCDGLREQPEPKDDG